MKENALKIFLGRVGIGFLVGIGAVAPGISGGAIAVIFGLYQEITGALAHLVSRFRQSCSLLLPLAIGGGFSVLLCGRAIEYGFAAYPILTKTLFIGLMLGTLPSVWQDACRRSFRFWYPLFSFFTLFLTIFSVKGMNFTLKGIPVNFGLMFLCGAIVGVGTIVPGISTSFTLMSLGLYDTVLHAVNSFDFTRLFPLTLGCLLFIALFARLIDLAYRHFYGTMSFLVIGLLLGSVAEVFPPELFTSAYSAYWLLMPLLFLITYLPLRYFSPKTADETVGNERKKAENC